MLISVSKKLLKPPSIFQKWKCMCHPCHVDTWNGRVWDSLGSGSSTKEPALVFFFIPQTKLSAFFHFRTHLLHLHIRLSRSLSHPCSSRSLDTCCCIIPGSSKMAPIAVGETIPDGVLSYLDEDNTSQKFHVHEELKGKKVVLLAVPGAFTPTCRYLSLSLSLEVNLEGYFGKEEFSWVIVAWGSIGSFWILYSWSSSWHVEECGVRGFLIFCWGRCVSPVWRSLFWELPCEGVVGLPLRVGCYRKFVILEYLVFFPKCRRMRTWWWFCGFLFRGGSVSWVISLACVRGLHQGQIRGSSWERQRVWLGCLCVGA